MRRIQVWSNSRGNEFAIRLDSDIDFRAMTKPGESYLKLVDENAYLEDLQYNWNYTLKWWIDNNSNNGGMKGSGRIIESPHLLPNQLINNNLQDRENNGRDNHKKRWLKPNLKCHYCGLVFVNVRERTDHEKEWHKDKLSNGNSLKFGDDMSLRKVKNNG